VKRNLLAGAAAVLVLACVAACSASPGVPATSSPTTPAAASAPVNNRTYTKTDLQTILDTVNTKLKLDGATAITDGPKTESVNEIAAGIGDGSTTSPASCAKLGYSNVNLTGLLGTTGVIVGTTSGPHLNLIVATTSGTALPASLTSSFTKGASALLATCKHVTVTWQFEGKPASATIDFTPLPVTTDAARSLGFDEKAVISSGGGASTTDSTWVEAIDGNLLIFVTSVTDQDKAGLEKAVNATVSAARS
jgi:hypothetical protein